jgi:hypothetical protein
MGFSSQQIARPAFLLTTNFGNFCTRHPMSPVRMPVLCFEMWSVVWNNQTGSRNLVRWKSNCLAPRIWRGCCRLLQISLNADAPSGTIPSTKINPASEVSFWDVSVKFYSAASHCPRSGEFVWSFRRLGFHGPSFRLYNYLVFMKVVPHCEGPE